MPNVNANHLYHTPHDSVSVVRTTFKVYGKWQTLTKFEWHDYVVDPYHQKNLGSICPGVIREIYTPLFEIYYTFLVLQLAYRRVR